MKYIYYNNYNQLSITKYQIPIINYQISITKYQFITHTLKIYNKFNKMSDIQAQSERPEFKYIPVKQEEESTCKILINECYGGFTAGDEAKKLFNEHITPAEEILKNDFKRMYEHLPWGIRDVRRDSYLLVQIFEYLGNKEFSDSSSYIDIKEIPIQYKKYYFINDYDGFENIEINKYKYIHDNIQEILKSSMSDKDKLDAITILNNTVFPPLI